MAPQMFSATGTIRVKCPWHLQCSVPLALLKFSGPWYYHKVHYAVFILTSGSLEPPLLIAYRSALGWSWNFPSLLWGSSWSPHSPWEQSGLWLYRSQCPPLVTGQSPPALLVCVMGLHTAWCWPVGLTVNVICWLALCCWKKLFFVWLLLLAACWPTCASWLLLSSQWRVASNVTKQLSVTPVSMGSCPLAIGPTLGARIGLTWVYHPIQEGWLMH